MVAPITVKLQDSQEAVISIGRVEIRDTRGYTPKLQDSQEAVISIGRVEIRDTRGYTPKLITILDIEDAIALAKMILAMEEEPINADEAWIQRMELQQEARWDAISERA